MSTQYTTPPPDERWHNPENAPAPPDGWRYMLESEVRPDQNWCGKGVECKFWSAPRWIDETPEDEDGGRNPQWTYIVPDATPFDIPAEESAIVPDSVTPDATTPLSPGDVVTLAPKYSGVLHPVGWRAVVVELHGDESLLIGINQDGTPWQQFFPTFMIEKV